MTQGTSSATQAGIRRADLLLFFIVAPFVVACIETFLQLSMLVDGDLAVALGFALAFTIPGQSFAWLVTWLIARLPKADRLPMPLLLLAGYWTSLLVFRPYNRFIYDLMSAAAPHIEVVTASASQAVARFLFINIPAAVIWVGLNLLFIVKRGYPVYGLRRAPETAETPATGTPDFLRLAGLDTLAYLWSISAEEHYLRLRGRFGTRMIRHSFGAALDQLPPGCGLQVHRSHWVAFGCVEQVDMAKAPQLVLRDGTAIPVSSRYKQAVRLTQPQFLAA